MELFRDVQVSRHYISSDFLINMREKAINRRKFSCLWPFPHVDACLPVIITAAHPTIT